MKGAANRGLARGRLVRLATAALACAFVLVGSAAVSSAAEAPVNNLPPEVVGSGIVGERVVCAAGSWSGGVSEFRYAWVRDGLKVGSGVTYFVTSADRGHAIWCVVTATGGSGTTEAVSVNSLQIGGGTPPRLIAAPEVSGTPALGETLSCSTGTWSASPAPSFTYQWVRDRGLPGEALIASASESTYLVAEADQGHSLGCNVTASNNVGNASAASSNTLRIPGTQPKSTAPPQVLGINPASIGEALTCSPGTWSGSPAPTFTYRWVRDRGEPGEALIASATSSTYTVRSEDQLHSLSCQVTATNTAGRAEATSANSISVLGAPPKSTAPPVVRGMAEVGHQLICEPGSWSGVPTPTISYLWVRDRGQYSELALTTSAAYTPSAEDRGHAFVCEVTATNSEGHASEISQVVVVPGPTGSPPESVQAPEISGTPAPGQVLSCSTGTWNGTPAPTFTYRWVRDLGKAGEALIASATSNTYTVAEEDETHTLSCNVTAANEAGSASRASASATVPGSAPENVEPPQVFGAGEVGQQMTCLRGTWKGQPAPAFAYRWLRDGTQIASAAASTYTVTEEDRGTTITCEVTASNSVGSATAPSGNGRAIAGTRPGLIALPHVVGTPAVGETLTCLRGVWSGQPAPTFAYQWQLNGTDVPGATQETFILTNEARGFDVSCEVRASNREGIESASSNAIHVPGEKPEPLDFPQVSLGTQPVEEAIVGQQLTCARGRWRGAPPPQFTYEWLRDGTSIPSATNGAYSVEPADLNHVLSCVATGTNGEGSASARSTNDTLIRPNTIKSQLRPDLNIPPLEISSPPTRQQIRDGLRVQLARAQHRAHISVLRRQGVYVFPFTALVPGKLEFTWCQTTTAPAGRSAAPKLVLLARGTASFAAPGRVNVKLRVTSAGRSAIGRSWRIPLTIKGVFVPPYKRPITWSEPYVLSH